MAEAAKIMGCSYHSIFRLVKRGQIKACRAIPRRPLIAKTEILRLLEAA
jgi:excisionase family DNA binding protein